jgi:hypothetical protein
MKVTRLDGLAVVIFFGALPVAAELVLALTIWPAEPVAV